MYLKLSDQQLNHIYREVIIYKPPSNYKPKICNRYAQKKKKNEILPFAATQMDSEGIILSEMSDKERQISYDITWMWNLKNTRNY